MNQKDHDKRDSGIAILTAHLGHLSGGKHENLTPTYC